MYSNIIFVMTTKHKCDVCNYETVRLSNYNKHLETKKHLAMNKTATFTHPQTGMSFPQIGKSNPETGIKKATFNCEYCGISVSQKGHLTRHYKTCNEKIKDTSEQATNDMFKKLEREKSELEQYTKKIIKKLRKRLSTKEEENEEIAKEKQQLVKEKDEIAIEKEEMEKDFMDHLKKIATSKTTTTNNQINISGDVNMNICYVIKNFTKAKNYEDLMAPALTRKELKYIKDRGPAIGRERIIMDRCVTNVKKEERPIQCVDYSRYKFALRTKGKWVQDWNGKRILEVPNKIMRKLFDVQDKYIDIPEMGNRVKLLLDMERADKRTIKYLGKETLLQNK
jgi:hypothetical protein